MMKRFLHCRRGNFAVAFSIAALPVLGAAGMAVDYSRAINIKSYLQVQADAAALAAARVGYGGKDTAHLDYLKDATALRFGEASVTGLEVLSEWPAATDYKITVSAAMPTSILSVVPGFDDTVPISVTATGRIAEPRYVYEEPKLSELDNEAGDYNRIYVYCFDPVKAAASTGAPNSDTKGKGKNKGKGNGKNSSAGDDEHAPVAAQGSVHGARSQMTPIADNAGTRYQYTMPRCDAGQTLSFKLLNVRLVRGQPAKWEDPASQRFEYYTDTQLQNGSDTHDLGGWNVLETALCSSLKQCEKKSKGGIVPEGKNRTPVQATGTCSAGKYMYYGWEDRPPGQSGPAKDWTDPAWTDRDYDDIRIVIKCPSLEADEERMVRLVN